MGQACTFGRVKVIDAIQSNKENAFLSEPHHFPEQAVDFVRADDIQTVGGELAATDDISALFWEVEFRNFGLGHFIPLGRPCICNSAITFCNVRRHNFNETFWRMQNEHSFCSIFLPARRALLVGEFSEAPKADDVAVFAFEDSALRHVEADGALEGGDGDGILMFCVVFTRRLHNYQYYCVFPTC